MSAKPIIFNDAMARAILDGQKTQTRRAVNHISRIGQLWSFIESRTRGYDFDMRCKTHWLWHSLTEREVLKRCPYGRPGDLLWVREAWTVHGVATDVVTIRYRANARNSWTEQHERFPLEAITGQVPDASPQKWRPSIHMPRWASRLTLEITDVRVERLQDISEGDAETEGVEAFLDGHKTPGEIDESKTSFKEGESGKRCFRYLWESINGTGSWNQNPWVWVIEFRPHPVNIDQFLSQRGAA